jgi:diaminohydroxyphosphoribosylaminopyrimidine deaminase/5-amino-6-(5-phosphoribosylamino)uracil reductase
MTDPNPLVSGKGIRELKQAGIRVRTGILEDECKKLNEVFTKYITTKLPFVTLKIAQTLDGKIADSYGNSKWVTEPASRKYVHQLRSRYDAVLVGAGTVIKDNPKLTVRDTKGRNPFRVIVDGKFIVKSNSRIFSTPLETKTIIFISSQSALNMEKKKKQLIYKGIEIVELDSKNGIISLKKVLHYLALKGISSVLVEGGSVIFSEFIRTKLADKIEMFVSPRILGKGLSAFLLSQNNRLFNAIKLNGITYQNLENDIHITGYLNDRK